MGWFKGKSEPPVREDMVERLRSAKKASDEAFSFTAPDHSLLAAEERKADALLDAACRNATLDEMRAAGL
jgi:hypothetical protein